MDKKAKNILVQTYWKNGWIDSKDIKTNPADFAYAKEKGLMFDPLTISHDECIEKIFEILPKISEEKVSKAFLSSLSTRRLDWRSGLASYFIAKQLTPHKYTPVESGHSYEKGIIVYTSYTCGICRDLKYGIIGDENYENEDLNVLNFERIKWGRAIKSTKDEREVLMEILACIDILKLLSYDRPARGKNDWKFVEFWRGEDKYNKKAVEKYFGKYLNE